MPSRCFDSVGWASGSGISILACENTSTTPTISNNFLTGTTIRDHQLTEINMAVATQLACGCPTLMNILQSQNKHRKEQQKQGPEIVPLVLASIGKIAYLRCAESALHKNNKAAAD